ncbi:hypothetical protein XH89_00960 [Bradyrhizobium sp. CCBAU 53340]|nr:hypothetical protein XH89_00960 [Bradyrhizobium sp. CCBAU 53340]
MGAASIAATLTACTGLNVVHDPQGVMDRQQVQGLVKSVKCELITYLEANRRRKTDYFDVSEQLFGNVILDLNVVDIAGFASGSTSIDRLRTVNDSENFTWHFGPTLNGQGTYDMILSFLLPQNARISFAATKDDSVRCYSGPLNSDFEGLARGDYSDSEQFVRIRVNGVKPLASWLLDLGKDMWSGMEAAKLGETAYPAQMAYTFTVQVTAGLEVKYSLINPMWNPLGIGGAASTQQTNKLQFTLNGADASLASGASTGLAAIGGGTPPYQPPQPPRARVPTAAPPASAPLAAPSGQEAAPPQAAPSEKTERRTRHRRPASAAPPRGMPQGYLLAPVPIIAPRPVH